VSEPLPETDVAGALGRLDEQLTALRDEVRRLGAAPALPPPVDDPPPGSYAWVGALDAPVRRRPQAPRLLLEGLFLAAVAAAAAIADLEPVAIAGVMVGAWVLAALIEWAASRADRRQELPVLAPPLSAPPAADPAWFSPPVDHTMLDAGAADGDTALTRLPPRLDDAEATVEQRL